jgi:anaerobic ribonucleoside-triphosphate reductase activating protein
MLKYIYCKEVFQEVPNEIALGISISGCQIRCRGCHSRELWIDNGIPLTEKELDILLRNHRGITCLLLMGGEHDIDSLIKLFMYAHKKIKTAWYCGLDMIPKDKIGILQYLDFVKIGHYDQELGGLDSPTTNQRLYKIEHQGDGTYWETDITSLLQKKENN